MRTIYLLLGISVCLSNIAHATPSKELSRVVSAGLRKLSGEKGRRWKVTTFDRGEYHPGFYATSRGILVTGSVTPTDRGRYGQKLSNADRLFVPSRPVPLTKENGTVGRMDFLDASGWNLKPGAPRK